MCATTTRPRVVDDWSLAPTYLDRGARAAPRPRGSPRPEGPGDAVALTSADRGEISLRAWVTPDAERVLAARVEGATGDTAAVLDALCAEVEACPCARPWTTA